MQLSNIQETIERSLFERIRLEAVDKGYLPDITTYTQDATGYNQYQTDLANIRTTQGFAIEVFNHQDNQNTDELKVPRITIVPQPFMEGSLGGDQTRRYVKNGAVYDAEALPPQTSDYYCNIHLTGTNAKEMRILNALLSLAIPVRGYLPFLTGTLDGNFFCERVGYFQNHETDKGVTDLVYRYMVPDLFEIECIPLQQGINPLNQITVDTKVQDNQGNEYDADNTVITP